MPITKFRTFSIRFLIYLWPPVLGVPPPRNEFLVTSLHHGREKLTLLEVLVSNMTNRIRAGVGEAAKRTSAGPQFDELPHVGRFEQPQNLQCEARVGQWEYRIRDWLVL